MEENIPSESKEKMILRETIKNDALCLKGRDHNLYMINSDHNICDDIKDIDQCLIVRDQNIGFSILDKSVNDNSQRYCPVLAEDLALIKKGENEEISRNGIFPKLSPTKNLLKNNKSHLHEEKDQYLDIGNSKHDINNDVLFLRNRITTYTLSIQTRISVMIQRQTVIL